MNAWSTRSLFCGGWTPGLTRHLILLGIVFSQGTPWLSRPADAGDVWYVGVKYPESQLVSIDQITHRTWNTLLARYVDAEGRVNYAAWKRSAGDVRQLDRYLQSLSRANPAAKAGRAGRMAFWINAYNAVTVRGILREYPTTSIRNHTAKIFGYNIWKDLLLVVGGRSYSLEDIEHKVLRPMRDPRIHFAIVCASKGCPRLRNEAYTAERLDRQLDDNARHFFAQRQNFRYDPARRHFELSSILKWFGRDFGQDDRAMLRAIAPFLPESASQVAATGGVTVSYLTYDWSLNDQPARR